MSLMFDMVSVAGGEVSEPVLATADEAEQFALWFVRLAAVVAPEDQAVTIELTPRVYDDGQGAGS